MPQANPINWILHSNITVAVLLTIYMISFQSTNSNNQNITETNNTQHQWSW